MDKINEITSDMLDENNHLKQDKPVRKFCSECGRDNGYGSHNFIINAMNGTFVDTCCNSCYLRHRR